MKDPAFLFYSSDFLTGTLTMTNEQVGKYIKLLCLQHQKEYLTEKDMLFICQTYDEDVYSKFDVDERGRYFNNRLKNEIEKRNAYSTSRKANRNAKKNTYVEHMSNISKTYVGHMENENINEDVIKDVVVNEDVMLFKEVINYLNNKIQTSFKYSSNKTQDLIKARLREGFTLQDFYTVIDKKAAEWIDTDMQKFLRPETLFSNKFEGYLNQKITKPKAMSQKTNFEQRKYDDKFLAELDRSTL